ncbi:MAG: hypothetical protein AVDCRST_MAG75-2621 [uncultured Propionibacteriaceae bacterium]|uniref:Uncharacterized protein n=1 Tax=uncultured Propionibacteriaceae bacterium TaxID=257457 RepID=A0A6J4P8R2_9ACTN|nr:MAG: hypothetical protein AVDCRST_MAG75-2621 [uncultured Propionibacteriaceae bacterium]
MTTSPGPPPRLEASWRRFELTVPPGAWVVLVTVVVLTSRSTGHADDNSFLSGDDRGSSSATP